MEKRDLQPGIRRVLAEAKSRWRSVRTLEGALILVAAASFALALLFALDNAFHLPGAARFALLLAAVFFLAALGTLALLVRPLRVPSDEECALLIERHHSNLEDRLINAVYFRRGEYRGLEQAAVALVEEEAAARLTGLPWKRIVSFQRSRKLALVAAGLLCALGAYATLVPAHFRNALERYARPFSDVPPLSRTRLRVSPGDAEVPFGGSLLVRAETEGLLPEKASLHTSSGNVIAMDFDGRAFQIRLSGLEESFTYYVRAGDARSPRFRVRVARPPEVKNLDITIEPPGYTELPPRVEKGSTGNIEALAGSTVRLELEATRPLSSAQILRRGAPPIEMARVSPEKFEASIQLLADVEYSFFLVDSEGMSSPDDSPRRRLKALPDLPPECEILEPPGDLEAPASSAGLVLRIRAADDVGLARVVLFAAPLSSGEEPAPLDPQAWRAAQTWDGIRGKRESFIVETLALRELLGPAGRALALRAGAIDLKGSETLSPIRRIRFLEAAEAVSRLAAALEAFRSDLAAILRRERLLEEETSKMAANLEGSRRERLRALGGEQVAIRSLLFAVLGRAGSALRGISDPLEAREIRRELERAASDIMPAVTLALLTAASSEVGQAAPHLERALFGEREIIAILERAIGDLATRVAALRSSERPEVGRSLPPAPRTAGGKLEELLERLREYQEEAKEVLARTRAFEDRLPEDFSAEDAKSLEELAAIEENWGRLLEEKATDLSKVPEQDASVASIAEEVLELVEEIDLARDYLKGKNVELAVPVEQSGLALAEKLETNIERWLSRDRDRLKWVMEEPTAEADVPLADLPSEIEDIVGDLIDREELMGEETEDLTSSWLDSMDEGIGWDAMDGPISNMTAKGVTGNLLPNDMEIGGRSGEGRSGKSHGQIVEETASGKGGRQTPTRSTADAFEAGMVKDSGRDPTGGSTGGGKLSGAAPPGLRGPLSPKLERRIADLTGRQTQIREQAESLDLALKKRRYFSQNLARALELMRAFEEALRARRRVDYASIRKAIVSELRALERAIASERTERLSELRDLPASLEYEPLEARAEEIPSQYGELIREYYRSLGRGAEAPEVQTGGGKP